MTQKHADEIHKLSIQQAEEIAKLNKEHVLHVQEVVRAN